MAKNYSNKNRKRKALIAMLCALSVTCTGLAAACAPTDGEDEGTPAITAKDDAQLLKNGNFEHFDVPENAIHLIKNVNSWTLNGDTSVKSGIIGTSKSDWDKLTDPGLSEKLDYNNDLSSDNDEYVNYNSMRSRDIPYKDTYAAMLKDDDVYGSWIEKLDGGYEEYFNITGTGTESDPYMYNGEIVYKETKKVSTDDKKEYVDFYYQKDNTPIRKTLIKNPGTHYGDFKEEDGKYYFGTKQAYADDNGHYYFDEDKDTDPVGNVLMIHNAGTDTLNGGRHQYYGSSSVTLEAHTSAEISLWVKTSDLRFDKGSLATAEEKDLGAYIEVTQTVAGTAIDSFRINAINTQNLIAGAEEGKVGSNGWVQYTVYINACDFANTSIQLRLGLGGTNENEKVTGYAFFDDVQVKKYRELEAAETECTYKDYKDEIATNKTSCTLTSDEEEKIFKAEGENAYNFHYLIDLASDTGIDDSYSSINFDSTVEVGLTTEKDSKGNEYAAAEDFSVSGVTKKAQAGLKLPKDLKARPTDDDVITVFGTSDNFDDNKYSTLLNNLTGDNGAPENKGNTLVLFSAWGTPYTATVKNGAFTVPNATADGKEGYLLVSFWVKTSDMDGDTAATVKIYEYKDAEKKIIDEDSVKTLTIDTTGKTTDFEGDKDIYNGWVQCFVFVKNDAKDKDDAGNYLDKTFYIDFSFGTTKIMTTTSYESGYAAIANLQTLVINEDIYNLASSGDNTAVFSFTKEATKENGKAFAEATGTDDINKVVALPDGYDWANGANVLGRLTDKTAPVNAGLINKDVFGDGKSEMSSDEKDRILEVFYGSSFVSGTTNWDDVFGKNCYQPLIIINSLRTYAQDAKANDANFKDYYIYDEATETYKKVDDDAEYSEKETYYSLTEVANYGFIGGEQTVSANNRKVISLRVKVTGDAEAYIYLVDGEDTDEVLSFNTPAYTFWYDEEGNVLKDEFDEDWTTAEHLENVVYTLRDDGLYEADGKLYANLYNLVKSYKDSEFENVKYYDENGKPVEGGYDYVEKHDGETFYKENGQIADHYLCATDGTHVYKYEDGKYYYVEITTEDEKTTEVVNKNLEVNNFDEKYARYSESDNINEDLFVKVTKADCDRLGDENGWVTVNFVISTGSEEKNYRLALWSGDRGETGVKDYKDGAVAFDLFRGTVSESRLDDYEAEIIEAYNSAIIEVNEEINAGKADDEKVDLFKDLASGTEENIASYEKLIAGLDEATRNKIYAKLAEPEYGYVEYDSATKQYKTTYTASYYTYTLYDSASYVPFNATTAGDGETGYNYDASTFTEQLAYFEFEDVSRNQMNVFVDYSAVDQSFDKNTANDDDETNDEEESNNATELGLYISSIVLVVVLLVTLVSILLTQYIKKRRKASSAKNSNKNAYRKRDRYVKKLHLVKDEMVEPEAGEKPAEEVPAEEVTPVENEVTEAPAAETTETVEPSPTEEPTEGEDKE